MQKPRKPAELLGLSRGVEAECRKNQATDKWDLNARLLLGLTAANDALAEAIAAVQKAAFDALNRLFEEFIEYLHSNRKVPDTAFPLMGIRPRAHGNHEPLPVPEAAPALELQTGQHGQINAIATLPTGGQPAHKMAPRKYHAVLFEYRVKGEGNPQQESVTRKSHVFRFPDGATGKVFEIRAAWQNPRLQAGPWSDWVSALIN
jgi:hypothetical protein